MCGYESCHCKKYGSLDIDQHERHPDTAAQTCPDYIEKMNPKDKFEWNNVLWSFERYTEFGYIMAHAIRNLSENSTYPKGKIHFRIPIDEVKRKY